MPRKYRTLPNTIAKSCSACRLIKPLGDFYAAQKESDGRASKCKRCFDPLSRRWDREHPEARRSITRQYDRTHRGVRREQAKARRAASPRRAVQAPERHALYQRVYRAVKRGELVTPQACEVCGAPARLHAHHYDGYDKPLAVIWMCPSCHKIAHPKEPKNV